jgi:DNA-binding NarL/FixJ family response regulator
VARKKCSVIVPINMMNIMRVLVIGGGDALVGAKNGLLEQLRITRRASLAEGVDTLRESAFQLVLLDLSLVDTSAGESVTKMLRIARDLPVIAFLNDSETGKDVEAMGGGTQGRVVSGCQLERLIRMLRCAIERKQLIVDDETARRQTTKDSEELIAHSSHDIRNALTCIFQFGNILKGGLAGELSAEQQQYLGIIIENASRIRSALGSLMEVVSTGLREGAGKEALSNK